MGITIMIAILLAFAASANAKAYKRLHDTEKNDGSNSLVYAYESNDGTKINQGEFDNLAASLVSDVWAPPKGGMSWGGSIRMKRVLGGRRLLQGGFCYSGMSC